MTNCDLLLWRNPVETGKVFGGLLVSLLVLKKVNLITFFLKFLYMVFLTTGSIEFASKLFLGQGLVTKYGIKECPDIVGFLKPRIDQALTQLPVHQAKLRKLVFAASPKRTLKAAGVTYVAHKLFSVLSLWTFLFVSVIFTFTLPLIYKTYQKEIDATAAKGVQVAKSKASEVQNAACEKASPYIKQLDEKLGPVSGFVKSKLPATRTAGSTVGPEATTTKLAAQVPIEEPTSAKTSSASFPSVPSTKLGGEVKEEAPAVNEKIDIDIQDLKDELKKNKESVGF